MDGEVLMLCLVTSFIYYLFYIIPLFGVILLICSLCLTFVKEKHRYKIVFFCMFPIPLLDDGESYMPKPVVEIYRNY